MACLTTLETTPIPIKNYEVLSTLRHQDMKVEPCADRLPDRALKNIQDFPNLQFSRDASCDVSDVFVSVVPEAVEGPLLVRALVRVRSEEVALSL